AGIYVCKAGHLAIQKKFEERKGQDRNPRIKYLFDTNKCNTCPLQEGCYKKGAKTKSYSVTIKSTEHKDQEAFQKTVKFKELSRNRYKIEAKNSELKHAHEYETAKSSGLFGMQIQGATTIFAVNIKRILKLIK
ncbi:transposase, partial [Cytobacillus gottheilii]